MPTYICTSMCILKFDTNELFTKQKQIHRHRKQIYGYQGENGGEGQIKFGISRYKLLYMQ